MLSGEINIPKIVIDTNTLVSALGWRFGKPRAVFDKCVAGKLKLLQSRVLIKEFEEVINRPKFSFIPKYLKVEFIEILLKISEIIEPDIVLNVIVEDDPDNRVLECAICGNAWCIVSGNRHLLTLGSYNKIKILNANAFLQKLIICGD